MSAKRKAASAISASVDAKKSKQSSLSSFFGAAPTSPAKVTVKAPTTAPDSNAPFDKDRWVDSLSEKNKELLDLEIKTLHISWFSALHGEFTKPYFLKLKEFLKQERENRKRIFPPEEDVYSWARHTPLDKVKVVILGQDPYHGQGQAHGLCFSVRPPINAPPSLKNIYTALKNDYPDFTKPREGVLTPWADRGVLLINTCLTVEAHKANSHAKKGWEEFTAKVLKTVAEQRSDGVVFLAWGSPAQKNIDASVPNKSRHLILKSVHPSPLSAHRGFMNCGHFKQANAWLKERYGSEGVVEWDCLADEKRQNGLPVATEEEVVVEKDEARHLPGLTVTKTDDTQRQAERADAKVQVEDIDTSEPVDRVGSGH
ncbi:uracil DNA glycosylase [Saitoella coloradoensis]